MLNPNFREASAEEIDDAFSLVLKAIRMNTFSDEAKDAYDLLMGHREEAFRVIKYAYDKDLIDAEMFINVVEMFNPWLKKTDEREKRIRYYNHIEGLLTELDLMSNG